MAEPKQEDIDLLANISKLHPSEAIKLLKAHNNDINAAAAAFFDSPNQYPPYPVVDRGWDESAFHSDKTDRHQPACTVNPQDTLKPSVFSSAPSRPPSRVSIRPGQSIGQPRVSISNPQEARDLDQALKMSMMNSDSHSQGQMTGVTNALAPHFGPARQEHYDKNWQITVPGDYTKEILLNPEPADRKRDGKKPAFLRPSTLKPSTQYHRLHALIKILQAIPLTREAMVCRDSILSEYGRHPEWWDGTSIRTPETVHEEGDRQDHDVEEVLYETQRLVAFLEDTERAYASVDSLVDISRTALSKVDIQSMGFLKDEEIVPDFFKAYGAAIASVNAELTLHKIVESVAVKAQKESVAVQEQKEESKGPEFVDQISFTTLHLQIFDHLADKGHTLYDLVDDMLWAHDTEESIGQDHCLKTVAEVFILDVRRMNEASSGLGIRIPAVWYLDRYLPSSLEETRRMRKTKAAIEEELNLIEAKMASLAEAKSLNNEEKRVPALTLLKSAETYFDSSTPRATTSDQQDQAINTTKPIRGVKDMYVVSERVSQKLQSLEDSRKCARAKLEEISKLYTKPAADPEDPPYHRWTLRGVCSDPKTVYVLEKTQPDVENDMLSTDAKDWQWWKITYVGSDSKPVSQSKVREIEVLKAAKDESNAVLLVYASEYAVNYEIGDLPSELRNFVRLDNLNFRAELEKSGFSKPTTPKRKSDDAENDDPAPNYYGSPLLKRNGDILSPKAPSESNLPPPYLSNASLPAFSEPENSRMSTISTNSPKSHEEAIPISPRCTPSTINPAMLLNQAGEQPAGQEMEDKGGMMGIVQPRKEVRSRRYSLGSYSSEISMDDADFDQPHSIHIEYADGPENER